MQYDGRYRRGMVVANHTCSEHYKQDYSKVTGMLAKYGLPVLAIQLGLRHTRHIVVQVSHDCCTRTDTWQD